MTAIEVRAWTEVPQRVRDLTIKYASLGESLRCKAAACRRSHPDQVAIFYIDVQTGTVSPTADDDSKRADTPPAPPDPASSIPVSSGLPMSSILGPIGKLYGFLPGKYLGAGSSPLVNLLAGMALTGGAGYAAGWLGEKLLPSKHFEEGRMRRNWGLIGAGLGAIPGLYQMADNVFGRGRSPFAAWPSKQGSDEILAKWADSGELTYPKMPLDYAPIIGTDSFNRVVWSDAMTPVPIRAATTGLTTAADLSRGSSGSISPFDIARVIAGSGVGWGIGTITGKVLGAMAGLKPESQQAIQRIGTWSGLLSTVIPLALGR